MLHNHYKREQLNQLLKEEILWRFTNGMGVLEESVFLFLHSSFIFE